MDDTFLGASKRLKNTYFSHYRVYDADSGKCDLDRNHPKGHSEKRTLSGTILAADGAINLIVAARVGYIRYATQVIVTRTLGALSPGGMVRFRDDAVTRLVVGSDTDLQPITVGDGEGVICVFNNAIGIDNMNVLDRIDFIITYYEVKVA